MSNAVGRSVRSYAGADFQRLLNSNSASYRVRRLVLPDGEDDQEVLAVVLEESDGTVMEVRGAADGRNLVLSPTDWADQDMAGYGKVTAQEMPVRRSGYRRVIKVRHILGNRGSELVLEFEEGPDWSIRNSGDVLQFTEVV
ncbi:MAG: hypothetical protein ABIV25_09330 [Paracoccaceae bacterium]